LDYRLGQLGVDPKGSRDISMKFTHLGVAASIASRRADCRLGIAAAAMPPIWFIHLEQEVTIISDDIFNMTY
jgi:molybdate-binding protein